MSRAEKGAAQVRRAAQPERAGAATPADRRQSDSDAAAAHPTLTDSRLRSGHPPRSDGHDRPDDDGCHIGIEESEIERAAAKRRGGRQD